MRCERAKPNVGPIRIFHRLAAVGQQNRKRSLAPGCAAVRLSPEYSAFHAESDGLFSTLEAQGLEEGKTIMRRVILGCLALLFLTSPLGAQQAPPDQTVPDQAVPQSPPPSTQSPTDLPPFIPPPRARLYDNYRTAVHHRATHHRVIRHHRRTSRHHATRRHHAARHAVHFSKRTVRRCHAMAYNQIMRHGSCRVLMKQELLTSTHRHHPASHHSRSARHHRSGHRHRR